MYPLGSGELQVRVRRANVEFMGIDEEPESGQGLGTPSIESLADSHPGLIAEFRTLDPIATAASFGALLLAPELQANCYWRSSSVPGSVIGDEEMDWACQ